MGAGLRGRCIAGADGGAGGRARPSIGEASSGSPDLVADWQKRDQVRSAYVSLSPDSETEVWRLPTRLSLLLSTRGSPISTSG